MTPADLHAIANALGFLNGLLRNETTAMAVRVNHLEDVATITVQAIEAWLETRRAVHARAQRQAA